MAVAAEAMVKPIPLVIASRLGMLSAVPVTILAVARVKTVPVKVVVAVSFNRVVASVAAVVNSDKIPAPEAELTPVWATLNIRPVAVMAVAEESTSSKTPLVAEVVPA